MRRSIKIARQAGKPEGWLGKLIAVIMSFETSKANKIALELLEMSFTGGCSTLIDAADTHGQQNV